MRVVGDVGQQRCSCNRGKRLAFLLFQEKNVIMMRDFHEYDSLYIKGGVMVGELCLVSVFLHLLMILFPNAMHALAGTELYEDRVRTVFIIANLAYLLALSWVGIVLDKRSVFIESILKNTQKISVLQLIIMLTALYLLKIDISLTFLLIYSLWLFAAFSIWRVFLRLVLKSYRSHGGNTKRVVVLGAGSMANQVYNQLVTNISYGYKFMGFFDDRDPENYKVPAELVKGKLADVNKYITDNDVHIVYCALPAGDDRKAIGIIRYAEQNFIRCLIVPDFRRFIEKKVELSFLEEIPLVSLRLEPLHKFGNRVAKRLFDVVFSGVFLVTIFPILYIVLGTIIKLTSPGPIFFKQKRTGENGRDFYCIKFRSMHVNKEEDTVQATKNDSRVSKIGAFMRKTNLDEMPQFINVFVGDMSIVGPRPHMLKHTEMYSELIDKYMLRHWAKPGITGWAQVTGFRGETQTLEQMEGRVKRDVWYIENWSFALDLHIIFLTVWNMIKGEENAY